MVHRTIPHTWMHISIRVYLANGVMSITRQKTQALKKKTTQYLEHGQDLRPDLRALLPHLFCHNGGEEGRVQPLSPEPRPLQGDRERPTLPRADCTAVPPRFLLAAPS